MNVSEILAGLDDAEGLPREALRAATEHRAALVPRFIEVFDTYTLGVGDKPMLFFAFHLLGQWRETSAYRPLCRFLRRMGADIETAMGEDTMAETSHRVMAAVFDGDPAPLYEVIYDTSVDEYVRGNMCMALAMLTARGQVPRAETERFLREAFDRLRPRKESFVWVGWEIAVVQLGMVELKPLVEAAYRRGSIDKTWSTLEDSEEILAAAAADGCAAVAGGDKSYTLFGDAIEEFSTWYGFSEKARQEQAEARQEEALALVSSPDRALPLAATMYDGVPLKAPCPCGSGRKFKHCHGRAH
jgi:hypothetical protein